MKRLSLDLYESVLPPTRTDVLWVDMKKGTGDIKAVHRYKNGKWEPYLVSVEYMKPESTNTKND